VPGKENPITATIQREYPKIEDGTPEQTPAPPGETAQPEGASEPVDYAEPVEYAAPVKKSRAGGLIAAVIVVLLMGGAFAAKVLYFDKKTDPKPAVTETKETTGTATSSNADTPKEGETTDASESGETQTPTTAGDTPGTESAGTGTATAGDETIDTEGKTAGDETAGTEVESTGTEVETATDTPPQTSQSGESTAVASKLTPSESTPPATPVESADTTAAPAASKTSAKNSGPQVAHKAPASRGPSSTTSTTPTGNKIRFSTDGSSDNAELVTDYVRKIFSENKFKLVSRSANAGYRMVVKVSQMASVTKEFYGRSSVTQRVNVTVSAISLQNGETIAITGPTVIEYTSLNEEENLQEAAKRLTYKMLDKLKNQ
ncbi:MAG: hypothetical protein GY757_17710, partial [bacterium]|nr:hypothetical protein [bacterium]